MRILSIQKLCEVKTTPTFNAEPDGRFDGEMLLEHHIHIPCFISGGVVKIYIVVVVFPHPIEKYASQFSTEFPQVQRKQTKNLWNQLA